MPASVTTNRITATPILGHKFNRISPIISTYPAAESGSEPITSISVIRIGPPAGLALGSEFAVRMLERHAATTQAFVPMAKAGRAWDAFNGQTALERDGEEAGGMVVVGCLNGADDRPDLSTLKIFLASPSQGVCYHAGIWHHSVVSLSHADYAAIDTQITTNSGLKIDCEILRKAEGEESFAVAVLPRLGA